MRVCNDTGAITVSRFFNDKCNAYIFTSFQHGIHRGRLPAEELVLYFHLQFCKSAMLLQVSHTDHIVLVNLSGNPAATFLLQ